MHITQSSGKYKYVLCHLIWFWQHTGPVGKFKCIKIHTFVSVAKAHSAFFVHESVDMKCDSYCPGDREIWTYWPNISLWPGNNKSDLRGYE